MNHPYDPEDWDHWSQAMSNNVKFLRKDVTFVPEVRSPTVRRRELGALLRKLRTEKGLTVEQAAEQLMFSMSKLSRMETGHGVATPRDIRDLCDLYGVTDDAQRDHMRNLATEAKRQAWWQSYDLGYGTYVGLEADAVTISAFQSSVVHGLLHTADYAVVLDEAALHRVVGGRQVMAAQLAKILDMAAWPNVTVQVLPYDVGAHPALESNFTILELPDLTPGIVFVEGMIGSTYLERGEDLKRYREIFCKLQSMALNPQDTTGLIAEIIRSF